jgi:hypothetical protein
MEIVFNGVDHKEQALTAVRNMRYPRRSSRYMEPGGFAGLRPNERPVVLGRPQR